MKAAVRYYSRSGHTKAIAEAIAAELGVEAVSVDSPEAALTGKVDVLFIGGALYAYGLDRHLKDYLNNLDGGMVEKAALFSSASLSRHALDLMRTALIEKNVAVDQETLFVKGKPKDADLKAAAEFAKKEANG